MNEPSVLASDFWKGVDPEIAEFEQGLLESIAQAKRGEGRVTTPEQIMRRSRGRPNGSVKAARKVATTIRLSPEVSTAFRATGSGWQTRIDAALKDWLTTHSPI
ncbi:MAG: BrnA antitoxin family protein [Rectinemataceae bacterium]|nr:BrnA antitoxin family protein [Rectinemataceae bacterium]